mgnify:CR=1 FL=1
MNARVLELIKNPELFQSQDLEILNSEIKKHPYIQSIRALHLFGIHKFDPEVYQHTLSTTAAYTTDKKILYQFINRNSAETKTSELKTDYQYINKEEKHKEVFGKIKSEPTELPKPVYVNGELNRILFEGEDNFLNEKSKVIDLESTLESGQIVTQNKEIETVEVETPPEETETIDEFQSETPENPVSETVHTNEQIAVDVSAAEVNFQETDEFLPSTQPSISEETEIQQTENLSVETVIEEEEKISEKTDTVENPGEISFHGTEEFFADIKIAPKYSEPISYKAPEPQPNKHEIEMQRLIAEVEAKMKAGKKVKPQEKEDEISNTDVNFSESQNFNVAKPEPSVSETKNTEISEEKIEIQAEEKAHNTIENTSSSEEREWKPMSFSGNTPDTLIGKTENKPEQKPVPDQPNTTNDQPNTSSETTEIPEERPVFNVSFFGQNVSPIESEKAAEKIAEETVKPDDSNVPTFINTWQNWLKIDRSKIDSAKPALSKTEIKNTVIENFIVKEPKISKLKEESDFVVKEKGDNISHLMTETLAKLYVEQKLYSKAIKAYQILSEKHPEKEAHFAEQINYVKDLRQNK